MKNIIGCTKVILILILLGFISIQSVVAQDSPIEIQLYLFAMDEMEIRQILKEGVTRDEMTALQTTMFQQNRLLEEEEPVTLSVGENQVEIPAEKMSMLSGNGSTTTVVLFFEVMPAEGVEEISAGTLKRTSYVVTENEDMALVRMGEWNYPAKLPSYRYFDFRYANVLGHVDFIYKIEANFNEEKVLYTISIK